MYHDVPVQAVVTVHRKRPVGQAQEDSVTYRYYLRSVVDYLLGQEKPFLRVALQFPDELLEDSVLVVRTLEELMRADARYAAFQASLDAQIRALAGNGCACERGNVNSTMPTTSSLPAPPTGKASSAPVPLTNPNQPTTTRFVVLADNTFGSCCPDEVTARHYDCECIVHFGNACMSRSTRLPVLYVQPAFHFKAALATASDQRRVMESEIVCAVLGRLITTIGKRQETYLRECQPVAIEPHVVVVASHQSKVILEHSQVMWHRRVTGSENGIVVDWCTFEHRSGGECNAAVVEQCSAATLASTRECWVINGVRFPRAAAPVLQYFLFVGSENAAQIAHLLGIHQYNMAHLTDEYRDFFTVEIGQDDNPALPALLALDEEFGMQANESGHMSAAMTAEQLVNAVLQDGGIAALYTQRCASAELIIQRRLRQRCFNIETIRGSSSVGILVASLAIEGYYETVMLLHNLLRAYGKRAYIIYIGHLNEFKLANFVDTVDCFVVVACPDSYESHYPGKAQGYLKPVVSPAEVLLALTADEEDSPQYGIPATYCTAFEYLIEPLREAVEARKAQMQTTSGVAPLEEGSPSVGALVRQSVGALITAQGAQGALERLNERSYVGLDPRVGETPVQHVIAEGKHGIARGYISEKNGSA